MFLNIEFPQIMDMDIPTNIVYFESNGQTLVEPPEINDLVTFPDPEIGKDFSYIFYILKIFILKKLQIQFLGEWYISSVFQLFLS